MARDLEGRADVSALVEEFYHRAFKDPLIGPIFTDVAKMDLAHHLPIMCDFWETVLFRTGSYRRNALQMHLSLNARVPLTEQHFERWLALWVATVDDTFSGEKAELAKVQATRIAGSMHRRMRGGSASQFETIRTRRAFEAESAGFGGAVAQ
jgi:hemoglobin